MMWRKQYVEPERDALYGEAAGIDCSSAEDHTVQAFREDADINLMMRRYGVTGSMPVSSSSPFYGDFSDAEDFQACLNRVLEAQAEFEALPSAVRNRFGNDPVDLMKFLFEEDNYDEALELGLVKKRADPALDPPAPVREDPEEV